jgi:hypothetical protein
MRSTHLCSHCRRRRVLLWASAFFVALGVAGTGGPASVAPFHNSQAPVQTASR